MPSTKARGLPAGDECETVQDGQSSVGDTLTMTPPRPAIIIARRLPGAGRSRTVAGRSGSRGGEGLSDAASARTISDYMLTALPPSWRRSRRGCPAPRHRHCLMDGHTSRRHDALGAASPRTRPKGWRRRAVGECVERPVARWDDRRDEPRYTK